MCLLAQYSWLFFLSRGVVGIGSASYSTIAPTVLGDLFVRDQRTRVLAIFYIFIPVGRLVSPRTHFPSGKLRPKGARTEAGLGIGFESQPSSFLTMSLYLSGPQFPHQ